MNDWGGKLLCALQGALTHTLVANCFTCLQGIPQWCTVMDDWGSKLLGAVEAVAAMAALGFGLPADAFTSRMALGPHLLAPTGSDLQQHGQQGTVLAGAGKRLKIRCWMLLGLLPCAWLAVVQILICFA
jgi:hypothetical protein